MAMTAFVAFFVYLWICAVLYCTETYTAFRISQARLRDLQVHEVWLPASL